ncbi:MAG: hypothetical protein HRT73_15390, partial [Flavobacteriales bacterium]|nr:hypothetical protein [Flavobacteriales bacterium]
EYVEAEKFEDEAKDQGQLGLSLKAMAAGAATEEDKAKKLSQIEKLNKMIAENEAKSSELKSSAAIKESQAKEASDKSDFILINTDENVAKDYLAIEKGETFDNEFMAKVMSRTPSTEPVTEELLSSTEEPIISSEEIVTTEEPILEEAIIEPEATTFEEPDVEEPVIEEPVTNNEELVASTIVPENIDEIPEVLSKSIFVINNNKAAYSNTKRIPISTKLPEGLVFKVQIGAFRNPIPQAHFKGFAPIMAEDAGNGITRYTAGLFKTFNMANEAKKAIRDIGYSDAFVVGFYNGKRISMNEARAMLAETNNTGEEDFAINNSSNNTTATNETNNVVTTEPIVTEEVKDGVSTDVRNIDGVFYAIQVGVYSKPVTAGQLNNVSPLNSERTAGGLIRYTSGVYKTLAEANVAKERIRGLGITDAFVVAYNGGRKIKVAEATSLLGSGNTTSAVTENQTEGTSNSTNTEVNTLDEETPTENSSNENVTPDVNDNLNLTTEDNITPEKTFKNDVPGYEPKENLNLEFRVKLGEYEEDVPVEDAGMFLKLTGRGIKNYEKEGKTVYTLGSFSNYESALDLQIEMKEMGVSKPETIVFREGVEISLETALELMKSNQ